MQLKILTTPEAFDTLGDQWNALLQQSATNTLFLTREWQRVWWKHLGDGDLRILTLHDGDASQAGQLIGIAPLFVEQNALGAGQVQFVGCKEVSDYLDFIFLKGRERECYEAVLDYLVGSDAPRWDGISLCNIPETSPTLTGLAEMATARGWKVSQIFEDVCPIIALPDTFEAYLAKLESKERRELQRKMRRADEDTRVTYAEDPASLDADMNDFLRLMRASMVSKNDFMTPRMETFFGRWLRICRRPARCNWPSWRLTATAPRSISTSCGRTRCWSTTPASTP